VSSRTLVTTIHLIRDLCYLRIFIHLLLPSRKDTSCFKKNFTHCSQLFRHPFFFWRFDAQVVEGLRQSVIDSRIGDAISSITRPSLLFTK
jgi:hypothetical protein